MTELNYIMYVFQNTGIGAGIGLVLHVLRTVLSSFGPSSTILVESPIIPFVLSIERSLLRCRYTEENTWDGGSPYNMAYMAIVCAAVPLLFGILAWSDRSLILMEACRSSASHDMRPLFCR